MKRQPLCMAVLLSVLALTAPAHAVQAPVVNGDIWMKSTPEEQKAFLAGMAVIIDRQYNRIRERQKAAMQQQQQSGSSVATRRAAPRSAQPGSYASEDELIVDIVDGMNSYTLPQCQQSVTQWYQSHPDQMQKPVAEVMWQEMAVPNLRAQGRVK